MKTFTNQTHQTLLEIPGNILSEKGSKFNIKTDPEFERSRKVLASMIKQLTQLGMDNKPQATRPLEEAEVDKSFKGELTNG